jgi:hypothetical protein
VRGAGISLDGQSPALPPMTNGGGKDGADHDFQSSRKLTGRSRAECDSSIRPIRRPAARPPRKEPSVQLFKRDPTKKLKKSYQQKMEAAMQAMRRGDVRANALLVQEAEQIRLEIDKLA